MGIGGFESRPLDALDNQLHDLSKACTEIQKKTCSDSELLLASGANTSVLKSKECLHWSNEWAIRHILVNFLDWIPIVAEGKHKWWPDWQAPEWLLELVLYGNEDNRKTFLSTKDPRRLSDYATRLLFGRLTTSLKSGLDRNSDRMINEYLLRRAEQPGSYAGQAEADGDRADISTSAKSGSGRKTLGQLFRGNQTKVAISIVYQSSINISQKAICERCDRKDVPLPRSWQQLEIQSWAEAYRKERSKVKGYLGKIHQAMKKNGFVPQVTVN